MQFVNHTEINNFAMEKYALPLKKFQKMKFQIRYNDVY